MSYLASRNKTADYLFAIGFEQMEDDKDSYVREYRKHNGKKLLQYVRIDENGKAVVGSIPPYKAITRTFGSEKFREPSVWDRLEQYGEMQLP